MKGSRLVMKSRHFSYFTGFHLVLPRPNSHIFSAMKLAKALDLIIFASDLSIHQLFLVNFWSRICLV